MRLKVIRMDLPLKHVKTTPEGSISVIRGVIVELEQDGLRGYGEVVEDLSFTPRVEEMARLLETSDALLKNYALADPIAFARSVAPHFGSNLPPLAALEGAACDLWGKMRNAPLHRVWKFSAPELPLSSYTLAQDSPERVIEKFEEAPDWPIYRLELGTRGDLTILEELRKRTDAIFRVDVGGRWSLATALDFLAPLEEFRVEFIEQPLAPGAWDPMKILKENSPIPIYADESCRSFADLEKCADCFHGVNLKPTKFGGLFPTVGAIRRAKELGLATLIGNPVESTIGAGITAQFAAGLDAVYLDGPLLIEKKIGIGVELNRGKIILPKENGTGIRFSRFF